jgi:hypothetical protein
MIDVQEAKYDGDYRIWLKFSSGEEGIVDLADIVAKYPAARPLLDTEAFKPFFLDEWPTLAWSSGFDLSPERLYELATGKASVWIRYTDDKMDRAMGLSR